MRNLKTGHRARAGLTEPPHDLRHMSLSLSSLFGFFWFILVQRQKPCNCDRKKKYFSKYEKSAFLRAAFFGCCCCHGETLQFEKNFFFDATAFSIWCRSRTLPTTECCYRQGCVLVSPFSVVLRVAVPPLVFQFLYAVLIFRLLLSFLSDRPNRPALTQGD